jgi:hypothetical protein
MVSLLIAFFVWGLRLPKRQYFSRDILISAPVEDVWRVVTDPIAQVKWRTDLRSVEFGDISPGSEEWVERPCRGAPVKSRVVRQRRMELLEVERGYNGLCSGQWIGRFEKAANATLFQFAETTITPNPAMRIFSHLFFNRGAVIERYQRDLKNYVEANRST